MSALNRVSYSAPDLMLAIAVGAGVNLLCAEIGQRFLQTSLPEHEARPLAIVSSTIGSMVGVGILQFIEDKMIALAFIVGIVVSAVFLLWSFQRSKASE